MNQQKKRFFFLTRRIDHLSDLGGALGAVCLLILAVMISYEVGVRYFTGKPTTWILQISVYLSMAIGFLGAAYALKRDSHFAITFFVDLLSEHKKRILRVFTNLLCIAYSITFIVKGLEMAYTSYKYEDVSTGLLAVPLWIPGLLLPLGGFLLALQFFNKLMDQFDPEATGKN